VSPGETPAPATDQASALQGALAELARKNAEIESLSARLEGMAGRMAEELRLASRIQRTLLPAPLAHPRLDLAAEFLPAREIGGDYYDAILLERGRLALALGDVMGKGVPAALLAANLKACLRAHVQAGAPAPAEILVRVNRLFRDVTPKGLFATLFFAVLDFEASTLEYVNAGHEPGLLVRPDGTQVELDRGGAVLGLLEYPAYETGKEAVRPDDVLVLWSDGVTDRGAPSGELFGRERLRAAAGRAHRDPARIALYTLLGEVQGWSGGRPPEDDQTLIVARVR
jgi:phosphoserine phosphatase RsbU/P